MRRRSREINIFSMSALDLFASAMGAFILITILLFPFYLQEKDDGQTQRELEQQLEDAQSEIARLQQLLQRTFMVVVLRWGTQAQDIDLYLVDPNGNEYSYRQHNRNGEHFPNEDAFLTVDSRRGPGVEVWLDPIAAAGRYRLFAMLYSRNGNARNPALDLKVYFRDGEIQLPAIELGIVGDKQPIGTIEVDASGQVRRVP